MKLANHIYYPGHLQGYRPNFACGSDKLG